MIDATSAMTPPMTSLLPYAALLALMFVVLSVRTLRLRGKLRIALGDGGNDAMLRAIRVHANFAEYVPLGLVLVYFVAVTGASAFLVNLLGASLLIGRLSHAIGVSRAPERMAFRVVGMSLTFATLIVSAVRLLWVSAA